MLIAISKYKKPLAEVDVYRAEHVQYMKKLFEMGKLLAVGRQNPPVGAVIITKIQSYDELKKILSDDPYTKADVAEYQIIEFTPTIYEESLREFLA